MANLYDTLAVAQAEPARLFAERNGHPPVTYGDLADRSGRYANALVACGVGPGDRVVVQTGKCIEMLFLYLACLRAGAVFLPANPDYSSSTRCRATRWEKSRRPCCANATLTWPRPLPRSDSARARSRT